MGQVDSLLGHVPLPCSRGGSAQLYGLWSQWHSQKQLTQADSQLEQVRGEKHRQLPQPCQVTPSHTTSDCWLLDSPSWSSKASCLSLHLCKLA